MTATNHSLSIAIQAPGAFQPVFIEATVNDRVSDLLARARQQGLSIPDADVELAVFLQDEDDELDLNSSIEHAGVSGCPRIHIARRGLRIEVVINFNGQTTQHRFGPGKTVDSLRKWAIHKFKILDAEACDYELALCDSESALDPAQHIGCLVQGHTRNLCLDLLVPSKILG